MTDTSLENPSLSVLQGQLPRSSEREDRSSYRRLVRRAGAIGVGAVSLAVWLGLWQAASVYEWELFFRFENVPAPTEVFLAAGELFAAPKFSAHVLNSVLRIFAGF